MGSRQQYLSNLLGVTPGTIYKKSLSLMHIQESPYYEEVMKVYESLGGLMPVPPCNLGTGDIYYGDIVIELDEENHFNRYRLLTLQSNIYQKLPKFPLDKYRHYCEVHENKCRKHGGYWSNPTCEKQFGKASTNEDLNGNGAPRWKQRAFDDYLKDLSYLFIGVPYVRISIYDSLEIDGEIILLDNFLKKKINEVDLLTKFIKSRNPLS